MKCKLFKPPFVLAVAFLFSISAHGQGTAFTYQGQLKQGGFAAYGTFDFHFAIYGSETGGGPVSSSVFVNGLAVSNGLFTVALDFGAGVFNSAPRWLQLGVKTNASLDPYTVLAPRQQLTPAPYAVYAGNAASANLVPWAGLQSVPVGFADGVDNDTTYSAVQGIKLVGTTLALDTNYTDARYWTLSGNSGTIGGTHFIGTTDAQPLDFRINNSRVLRLDYVNASPNFIGGYPLNTIGPGLSGAFIGSGGREGQINEVNANYAAIVGGYGNTAGGE